LSQRGGRTGRYRLQGFEIDESALELRDRTGAPVSLPPLAFDLMIHLIEHRDRVVTKDEIFELIWSDVAATDNSLSQAIWAVRRALGDTGGAQRVIKNVRGRGYRFVADVEKLGAEGSPPAAVVASDAARLPQPPQPAEPPRAAARRQPPPREAQLVGRDAELAQLRSALSRAAAGRGRIALLSGGPGVGKTRMAAELCEHARSQAFSVYEGRCFEGDTMPPFWPWQQVARALVRDRAPGELSELVGDAAGDLVKLIPELREGIPDLANAPERGLSQERFQLFDALRALLERAAQRAPLAIVLDDLHWADEPTLLCLEFLAPSIERMPLLLIATHRDASASPPLQRALAMLLRQGGCVAVELSGLPEAHVGALLAANGADVHDATLVRRVHDLTGGNPFFTIQLARWLAALPSEQRGADAELALPRQARALLDQQIAALPPACSELLRLSAVLGQPFHYSDLRRASGMSAEQMLERLEPALAARLIHEEEVGCFGFAHPTIRAALYDGLSRTERVRAHRRAAEALAHAHADDPSSRLGELAHHYYEAAAGGCAEQAVRYCMLAAERAAEATAYEEAALLYRRALAALELADGIDERLRCELLIGLGRSLRGTSGPLQPIRAAFVEAAARARAIGDTGLQCEAAMCFAGRGPRRVGSLREAGTVEPEEIALLEQALGSLGPEDSRERALVSARLSLALYHSQRSSQRLRLAREAVEVARRVGDPEVLAECLMITQHAVQGPAELEARLRSLDEIIELTRSVGLRGLQLDAHDARAWARLESGEQDGAALDVQAVQCLAEELRQPREKRPLVAFRMLRLDGEGRFDEAQRAFEEAQAAAPWPRIGDTIDQGRAIRDFMVLLFRGRSHEMIAPLEAVAEKFPLPVAWHCGLTSAYALAGRVNEARRELDHLGVEDFSCIPDDHNWLVSHALLANTCRVMDDARYAGLLYERLLPYEKRTVLIGMHGFCAGPVQRALAEVSLVLGELDRAEMHLELALERAQRTGQLIWATWCRLLYADLLLRRGRRADSGRVFEQLTTALSFARERDLRFLIDWGERLREQSAGVAPRNVKR
jgi:DNA-binding winged helix-turn-helix (wHTH) protein/tetratricopeptide (TPR) repeat protein